MRSAGGTRRLSSKAASSMLWVYVAAAVGVVVLVINVAVVLVFVRFSKWSRTERDRG